MHKVFLHKLLITLAFAVLTVLLFLNACGPQDWGCRGGMERECDAQQIVWYQILNSSTLPPYIVWSSKMCPTQPDKTAVIATTGNCVSGVWHEETWTAEVAWRGTFSASAYAHEHIHAWQSTYNIYDPEHQIQEHWVMETEANLILMKEGL